MSGDTTCTRIPPDAYRISKARALYFRLWAFPVLADLASKGWTSLLRTSHTTPTTSSWRLSQTSGLFERYQRSEKALVLALMEMVVQGVSTRRVKKITTELCGRAFSKSTVCRLARQLDARVEALAMRPLSGTRYPFLLVDALHMKVRRQGAVRSTTVMLAIGVNEEGCREILGIDLSFKETGEAWADFLLQLRDRGLRGVEFTTSDAHEGLAEALRERFPGAVWQRCQAHFGRNVIDETPASQRNEMHEWLNAILDADSPQAARARRSAARWRRWKARWTERSRSWRMALTMPQRSSRCLRRTGAGCDDQQR